MRPIALSLCDRTGNMLRPWADHGGFRCIAADIQHDGETVRDGIEYVGADVARYLPPLGRYAIVFAFPPCTHLASSGARWFRDKGLSALHEAIGLVDACRRICEWSGAPWMLENPVGTLSTYWREADHDFDPCDYGDPYTKKTCLWTGGGFVMPPVIRPGDMFGAPTWVEPVEGSKMHLLPPSPDRADLRSETPKGFARAVFEANHELVLRRAA